MCGGVERSDKLAVLARNRTLSKLEFYVNAMKLRKSMTFLLLRDLGVKSKTRNITFITKPMDEAQMMSSIFMGDTQTVQLIATGLIGYIGRGIVKGGDEK